jgi:1-acyl-sn-glycerol-3-phosphate acyltransferase
VLYRVGSWLFLALFRALRVDVRPSGHQHIPDDGPVILASNHIGYLDFAFVALAPPWPRRPVRFLARYEFFQKPVVGTLLRWLGQIPVDVHGDARSAAEAATRALKDGEVVGVHPEGTISPSFVPRRAKSGTVRLADTTGATIVPVALWGTQRLLTKWRPLRPERGVTVMVRYGEPFVPSGRTVIMTGGHDPFWGVMVDGPQEALKAARHQIYRGAGVIKLSATGGVYGRMEGESATHTELNPDEIGAVTHEAHKLGVPVAAHAIGRCGVGLDDLRLDAGLAQQRVGEGVAVVGVEQVDVPFERRQRLCDRLEDDVVEIQHEEKHDAGEADQAGQLVGE